MMLFTHWLMHFCRGVVCFELFNRWLKNDQILKMITIVENISIVDKSISINEINGVIGKSILSKNTFFLVMFWTELKSTGDIISEMNKFRFVTNPAFSVLFQFNLMNNSVIVKLKSLHRMLNKSIYLFL